MSENEKLIKEESDKDIQRTYSAGLADGRILPSENEAKECKYKFSQPHFKNGKKCCALTENLCSEIKFICDKNCQIYEDYNQLQQLKEENEKQDKALREITLRLDYISQGGIGDADSVNIAEEALRYINEYLGLETEEIISEFEQLKKKTIQIDIDKKYPCSNEVYKLYIDAVKTANDLCHQDTEKMLKIIKLEKENADLKKQVEELKEKNLKYEEHDRNRNLTYEVYKKALSEKQIALDALKNAQNLIKKGFDCELTKTVEDSFDCWNKALKTCREAIEKIGGKR